MKQLALDVSLSSHAVFETFLTPGNETLLAALHSIRRYPNKGETLFFSGVEGAGKSHLLHALCNSMASEFHSVYLDLSHREYAPDVLHGWNASSLICLDNLDAVTGAVDWEEALFDLFNRRLNKEEGSKSSLVMSASKSLAELKVQLPDLRSRISSGLVYQLQALEEEHLVAVLQVHAIQRGMELPLETAQYILKRLPRDLKVLIPAIDSFDKASLIAKRKLTIPFLRSLLD